MLLSKSFTILGLTFRLSVHLELIFACGVKWVPTVLLFVWLLKLSQHHLLKYSRMLDLKFSTYGENNKWFSIKAHLRETCDCSILHALAKLFTQSPPYFVSVPLLTAFLGWKPFLLPFLYVEITPILPDRI